MRLAEQFNNEIGQHIQYKLNAGKNIGNYNTSKLWHITEQSDRIFLKYLVDDVEQLYNDIDCFIAKTVISDKS